MKIKVAKELFVGIRNSDAVGWAVGYNNTTKKGKADQDKVERWCGKGMTKVIVNEPIDGFEIDKSVSRYSTSNKVWRIKDPRGFILEISTSNMEMLLNNCTMENGVVKGKCVWGVSNKMALLPESHPEFDNIVNEQSTTSKFLTPSKLKSGMILRKNTGEKIQYIGKVCYYGVTATTRASGGRNKWGGIGYNWHIKSINKSPAIVHLYKFIKEDSRLETYGFQKTLKAHLIEEGKEVEFTQEELDNAHKTRRIYCNGNFREYRFFLRKEETEFTHDDKKAFTPSGEEIYEVTR